MPGRDQEPSFQLASGTTNERDNSYNISNTPGSIFYNTDTSNVEVYHEDPSNNAGWRDLVMNNKEQIDISGTITCATAPKTGSDLCNKTYVDSVVLGGGGSGTDASFDRIGEFTDGSGISFLNDVSVDGSLVVVGDVSFNAHLSAVDASFQNNVDISGTIAFPTTKTNVGYNNTASSTKSSAVGSDNTASGNFSNAVGYANEATDHGSCAFGYNNTASTRASAVGYNNTASTRASAVGYNNEASGADSIAVGRGNTASGNFSNAVGYANEASGAGSTAVGNYNTASDSNSVAIGYKAKASGGKMYFGIQGCEAAVDQIYFDDNGGKMRLNSPGGIINVGSGSFTGAGYGVYGKTTTASSAGVSGWSANGAAYGLLGSANAYGFFGTNGFFIGAIYKGSGTFRIPHGLREGYDLLHSFVEGPQCDLIYRGRATLVDGQATISMDTKYGMTPGTFVWLTKDIQTFTSNETGWDAVKSSFSGDTITIECQNANSTDTISWMVVAERDDPNIKASEITDDEGNLIIERPSEPEPPR